MLSPQLQATVKAASITTDFPSLCIHLYTSSVEKAFISHKYKEKLSLTTAL
jgi:hypothetical protein